MAKQKSKIDFKGSIVIDKINELKAVFDNAVKTGKVQLVSTAVINEIDLSGVQLLYYMNNQLHRNNITAKWDLNISDELKLMLNKNGLKQIIEILTK